MLSRTQRKLLAECERILDKYGSNEAIPSEDIPDLYREVESKLFEDEEDDECGT